VWRSRCGCRRAIAVRTLARLKIISKQATVMGRPSRVRKNSSTFGAAT
jgi:hypothetical protein